MKNRISGILTVLSYLSAVGVIIGIVVSLFRSHNLLGFRIWTLCAIFLGAFATIRIFAFSHNRTLFLRMVKRAVRRTSFIIGFLCVVSSMTIVPWLDGVITSSAFDAAEKEISALSIVDVEKKQEIISRHLDQSWDPIALYWILPTLGMVLICISAAKSYRLVTNEINAPDKLTESEYAQQLTDFISGKRSDPPNSKK